MSDGRHECRAAATEVGRGEVSGDLVPRAKECEHNSIQKRSHCKLSSKGMGRTKNFEDNVGNVVSWLDEANKKADKEASVVR